MALRLATLLATVVPALTLSSHSPVDLESYPAFAVSFNEHSPILNETALELVREPLEVSCNVPIRDNVRSDVVPLSRRPDPVRSLRNVTSCAHPRVKDSSARYPL